MGLDLAVESPLLLQEGSWDFAAYMPYLLYMEEEAWAAEEDEGGWGSAACLLWAECLRAAAADEDWGDRVIDDTANADMLGRTLCAAFEAYLSEQQRRVASKRRPLRLHSESRRSLFMQSVSPEVLMDDEYFSVAAACVCGGWLLVDGGPLCRSSPDLLAAVLECAAEDEDMDLGFLLHLDLDLFRHNPDVVRSFPVILEVVAELRRDAVFMKELVTLDHCLLRFVDDRLLENQGVVTAAMTGVGGRLPGVDGEALILASEVLAGLAPNSRARRFARQVAGRLVDGDWEGARELAHRLLSRGRPSAPAAQGGGGGGGGRCDVEAKSALQPRPRCGLPAEPPRVSAVEEEIRRANEAARLAKQRAKEAARRPKLRNRARRAAHTSKKSATESESELQLLGAQRSPPTTPLRRPPLIISSVDLDGDLQEAPRAATPKKKQQKLLKRVKLLKARAEERLHVAAVFGVA